MSPGLTAQYMCLVLSACAMCPGLTARYTYLCVLCYLSPVVNPIRLTNTLNTKCPSYATCPM